MKNLIDKAYFVISKVFTDNGEEVTDRFCITVQRVPINKHPFDQICAVHSINSRGL